MGTDSTWDSAIKPLLLKRFPGATADDLTTAHTYAYGGCIIQDLGYYPFGSKFYSDLTHYVRSGDFIVNLIRESQDLDEYAFALGAMRRRHPSRRNPCQTETQLCGGQAEHRSGIEEKMGSEDGGGEDGTSGGKEIGGEGRSSEDGGEESNRSSERGS